MIGPSSSHTAGAARLAWVARHIIGKPFHRVTFGLHGSFAKTYKGHGTDYALVAGVLGMHEDDERLKDSFSIAEEQGLSYEFYEIELDSMHENSVKCSFINLLMARALSGSEVNASMGQVCAAPTAGACGILPAVLISVGEKYGAPQEIILKGLLTASGIGAVITKNATVSGAEGGCQAECGVAAAMAAAAAVQIAGGNNEMAIHACSLALIHCMGLICDPVAGLVQVPCAQRNASQTVNAVISADMALAGM